MPRRYGYLLITFNDGTTERVGGTSNSLKGDGAVLSVYTETGYSELRDVRNYPIANIKEYHWESS